MNNRENYQEINAKTIGKWVEEGWKWGIPIDSDTFKKAKEGNWEILLTPNIPVPKAWFGDIKNKKILGLASGGGQQMPIFSALGANCTVLDYTEEQLEMERLVSKREGYEIEIVKGDMTKTFPFEDNTFDIIFHPVSNCYIEDVHHVFRECSRVLKNGGILLCGLDNGLNYAFNEETGQLEFRLPFNPLKDEEQMKLSIEGDYGIQFSHTLEEQIGGQLKAGFILTDILDDTNDEGLLKELNITTFFLTRAILKKD